jgi:uncharacterized protein (DUF2062 family)
MMLILDAMVIGAVSIIGARLLGVITAPIARVLFLHPWRRKQRRKQLEWERIKARRWSA